MSFLLVAISMALVRLLFLRNVHFIWIPFCLVSVLVGFVRGTSPALLATLLGFLAFTFFAIPQDTTLSPNIWNNIRRPDPFALTQGTIALLAAQHAVKHRHVLSARRAIQELARASALKDYFISRAAHELHTPLTTILGETQLALRRLRKTCRTAVECQASFEKVETHARSLHALIEDVLTLNSCVPSRHVCTTIPAILANCATRS